MFQRMDVMGIIGNWQLGFTCVICEVHASFGWGSRRLLDNLNITIMFGYYLLESTMWFLCQRCGHLCLKVVHRRATLEDLLWSSNILDQPIQVILMNWQFSNPIKLEFNSSSLSKLMNHAYFLYKVSEHLNVIHD